MALHDQFRITKDTSARKNTGSASKMHFDLEVNAIKASYEAYIGSFKTGYEEKIEQLDAEHCQQLEDAHHKHEEACAALKVQCQEHIDKLAKQRDSAVQQAVEGMEGRMKAVVEEKEDAERKLKFALSAEARAVDDAKLEKDRAEKRLANYKPTMTMEVNRWDEKLASAWTRVIFRSVGIAEKKLFYRQNDKLSSCLPDLRKGLPCAGSTHFRLFVRNGVERVLLDIEKTLGEVCPALSTIRACLC